MFLREQIRHALLKELWETIFFYEVRAEAI
jgi:hypothetical protein